MASLKYKNGSSWVDYALTVYPVGAFYISYSSTSPATLFGGTWSAITGRFLYANSGTGTGGSDNIQLSIEHIPQHNHRTVDPTGGDAASTSGSVMRVWSCLTDSKGQSLDKNSPLVSSVTGTSNMTLRGYSNIVTGPAGSTSALAWKPSYQTVYCWRRTA